MKSYLAYFIIGLFCLGFNLQGKDIVNNIEDKTEIGPVIAFGDSLTLGPGVKRSENYPGRLGELLNIEIVNDGILGLTTRRAKKKSGALNKLLKRYPNPGLVLITLGGNDLLIDKLRAKNILDNLREIFVRFQETGAMVAYVGIDPVTNHQDIQQSILAAATTTPHADIEQICDEEGVLLFPKLLTVLGVEDLLVDAIHPNSEGYI